jgi:hypothetical protein
MTRDEFHDGVAGYIRSLMVPLAVAATGAVCWIIALFGFRQQLLNIGGKLFGPANANFIAPTTLGLVAAAMLIASGISHRPIRKDKRLRCDHCHRFLGNAQVRMIVIATGHCPFCGGTLFEPFPAPGNPD